MVAEPDPRLEPLMHRVLALVLSRGERAPAPVLPRRLDTLFRTLAAAGTPHAVEQTQDLIWAVWCDHPDPQVSARLHEGIAQMASEAFQDALATFDALLAEVSDWPEAWNKRATVYFILGEDAASLADIARVLEQEPRHFGAISGFGQIAFRNGFLHEAAAAFEAVLDLNPHLDGVRRVLEDLRKVRQAKLN